jgi:hypothetical protein
MMSCRSEVPTIVKPESAAPIQGPLARMGYAIQVGAFSNLENAVRLTDALQKKGLDPYYFRHDSGLYKVRWGNFPSRSTAGAEAEKLRRNHIIEEYYIVGPEDYPWGKENKKDDPMYLRKSIVQTARSFLGVPYKWGGDSPEEGFDCSGLAMAVYQLNGLELPRTSRQQWATGRYVGKNDLSEADLLFFATSQSGKITHVGVYVGNGKFIHAPKRGKRIRVDSISNAYYKRHYMGARTYI